MNLETLLLLMVASGQSLILNWGEDTGVWEISWICGNKRFTVFHKDLKEGVTECFNQVVNETH